MVEADDGISSLGEKLSSDTVTCGRRTGLFIEKSTHCVQVYNCWIGIACIGFITSGWATTPRRAVKHYPSPQVTQIDCYQPARTTSSSSLSMIWENVSLSEIDCYQVWTPFKTLVLWPLIQNRFLHRRTLEHNFHNLWLTTVLCWIRMGHMIWTSIL